jgi:hypothetical protein
MREVAVDITEDLSHPYGHALARFAVAIDPAPTAIRVMRRSPDMPYLGPAGWQAGPVSLPVSVADRSPGSTTLLLGPHICDQIPLDLQVRLEIEGADICSRAFWPAVMPTPGKSDFDILGTQPKPKLPERSGPISPPPPPPLPLSLPPEEEIPPVSQEEKKAPRRRLWPLLLLLLVVAGGLAAAYYNRAPLLALLHQGSGAKTFAERYRDLEKFGGHAHDLFLLGKDAYAGGDDRIGFLASDLASQRGDVDAALEIARWYDPRTFDPAKFLHPDANNAALYYSRLAGGNTRAKQLLSSLCAEAANPNSPYFDDFQNFLRDSYCPAGGN